MKSLARWLALVGAIGLIPCVAAAASPGFAVAAPPSWVERLEPDATIAPSGADSDGVQYLLTDDQVRFDGHELVTYRHRAARATNERGVESIANVKLQFDPSFERLSVHMINVRRAGRVVTRLDPAAIRLLQRETELDALLYDGSVTASAFLTDVRVGDIVEYAYSLRGQNPVFGGRQFGGLPLQWSIPVARVHARVSWPATRSLHWKLHAGAPPAVESESGGQRDRRWDLRNVAGRVVEDDAPGSFDPYWGVSWTEFDDWGAVVRWAQPLYDRSAAPDATVQAEARRIGASATDAEHRLLAVLRYVQSQVRYLGIEIGAGSHAPSRPEEVLRRRFGDCKDKTRLMIAMLSVLGIDAQPALVNTQRRDGVRDLLPTPGAFNHVLVHARIASRDWWLDPTRPPQAADPDFIVQSDHGAALLVADGSHELITMAGEQARRIVREIHATFDARGAQDRPVPYTVTTIFRGAAAENLRATLAGKSREAMQKDYLNFYAAYYRGVSVAQPFTVADNPSANELTVAEHYEIRDFWRRDDAGQRFRSAIEVPDLTEMLRPPRAKLRESPLWRPHPVDLRQHTEVLLSGQWTLRPEVRRVDAAAFTLERKLDYDRQRNVLLLNDHLVSRSAQVAAADVPAHVAELDRAREALDYGLQRPVPGTQPAVSEGPHWLVASVSAIALVGLVVGGWRLYRWDPAPWPQPLPSAGPPAPRGLRGWLLGAGFALIASALRVGRGLMEMPATFGSQRWLSLTLPGGDAYHPGWAPLLLFELLGNLTMFALVIVLLVLFAQRRSSVPRLFITLVAASAMFSLVDTAAWAALSAAAETTSPPRSAGLFWQFVMAAAWITYFLRSRRVAATFVERRPGAAAPHPYGATSVSPSTTRS